MSIITRAISANLGASKTGQAANLYYTIYSTDGTTVLKARSNSGVAEQGSSGSYRAAVSSWDTTWAGFIVWDISATVITMESFDALYNTTDIWSVVMSDISSIPAITASVKDAINWLFVLGRNKRTQTATTETVFKDDGTTTAATSTKSDDGSVFTRGKYS